MKIGLISDIHGDAEALFRVLERLETVHGVDAILCAGDVVGRGPDPERVIEALRTRNIPCVQGNHDAWAYGISAENRTFLGGLPLDWRGLFAGTRVFMTHGKPGNNMWGLYPEHVSSELVAIMLASLEADVLIAGHTHRPTLIAGGGCLLVNPGSLYLLASHRPSSRTYGVLTVPELKFEVYSLVGSPYETLPLSV
jgi:putative phosphoesterase